MSFLSKFCLHLIAFHVRNLSSPLSLGIWAFAGMAGTFVVAPNGFGLVGNPVPTAQHWLTLPTRQHAIEPVRTTLIIKSSERDRSWLLAGKLA